MITVRRNAFTPGEDGLPVFDLTEDAFGERLDVRDLEPFAIAFTEAMRMAKAEGVIQDWMINHET